MVPCADLPKLAAGVTVGGLVLDDATIRKMYRQCQDRQGGLILFEQTNNPVGK